MARLIDADAAKIRFANYREDCINEDDINAANVFADVVSELDEFPTIDPVTAAAEALGMSPDRLRELAQADREGRVKTDPKALKCPKCGKMRLFPRIDWQYYYCYSCKTQFPREAAEAALEEMEADHDR